MRGGAGGGGGTIGGGAGGGVGVPGAAVPSAQRMRRKTVGTSTHPGALRTDWNSWRAGSIVPEK